MYFCLEQEVKSSNKYVSAYLHESGHFVYI